MRAWRGADGFEGRSALRSWLYRIATNVCLDMLRGRERRARPMELGPSSTADSALGPMLPEHAWVTADRRCPGPARRRRPRRAGGGEGDHPPGVRRRPPAPARPPAGGADPARGAALAGDRGRRAARHQRGLGEQRAAAGPGHPRGPRPRPPSAPQSVDADQQALLARYVDAFERYDITALVTLLHEDAVHVDAAVRLLAAWTGRDRPVVPRPGHRVPWLAPGRRPRPTAARVRPVPHRPGTVATRRGPSRSSRSQATGSSGIHTFLDTELFAAFGLPARLPA